MNNLSSAQKVMSWIFQLIGAGILAMASFGKFRGDEVSQFIFAQTGMGVAGSYVIGIVEGFAALLLLTPNISHIGALIGFGTMIGALIAHATVLGIDVQGDGGLLVGLMSVVILTTASVMYIRRPQHAFDRPHVVAAEEATLERNQLTLSTSCASLPQLWPPCR